MIELDLKKPVEKQGVWECNLNNYDKSPVTNVTGNTYRTV